MSLLTQIRAARLVALSLALPIAGASAADNPADQAWLDALAHADEQGLNPADYPAEQFAESLRAFTHDVSTGRVKPLDADPDWHIAPPPAIDAGATPTPDGLGPPHRDYQLLKAALGRLLAVARSGGWPVIDAGSPLSLGARDPRVEILRARLRASGDYDSEMGADPWFFDTGMDTAVRRFQERHELPRDGIFGDRTRDAANVPVAERIDQITVTMERWRWLPRDLGPRYVWVNIPRASLDVVENGQSILAMRVVVGHRVRPTPSLAGDIDRVVFNPTWSVPRTIAVEDLLPQQQDDKGFLARHRIRVFSGDKEVNAESIRWDRLGADRFPYRLVQVAGPGNSLGRIKIAMDNPFDIYLHDTPAKGMFGLNTRTLSSGCVRLEDAPSLATLLIASDRAWTAEETAARASGTPTQTINLKHRIPIYLVYLTAWPGADGEIHFGRDSYGRDARVLAALRG